MNTLATDRPCIVTRIVDGELTFGQVTMRRDGIDSPDIAIHRLLLGEEVQLRQVATLVNGVQKTVEATLARAKAQHGTATG